MSGTRVRRFTDDERRARLGVRHRLVDAERADDPVAAAAAVVALHSTDPASVFLSAWARMRAGGVEEMERALYGDRTLVRVMGMRRTVFAAPPGTAGTILAACGRDVAARERRKLLQLLALAEPEDGVVLPQDLAAWLTDVEHAAVEALRAGVELSAAELCARDARLRTVVVAGRDTKYAARQKLGSRLLTILGADGRAVRVRPKGTWASTQFRWAAMDAWSPATVPVASAADARTELATGWLRAFGPATVEDLRWWTGWGLGATRQALAAAGAVDVDCAGTPGVALADDLEPTPEPVPWAALLPALDPTTMGWKSRDFYLAGHGPGLFDRTGNASPTVWWNGRIVGGWAQRPAGEVAYELLEDVGSEGVAAIDAEAGKLQQLLRDVRLTPRARGRSPIEAALVGS